MNKAHKRLPAPKLLRLPLHSAMFSALMFLAVTLSLFLPSSATAQNQLASLKAGGLNFTLTDQRAGNFQLQIAPVGGVAALNRDLTANVFAVENPTRLVIDIPQFPSNSARSVELRHPELSSVRSGIHRDKTRLVIDIRKNSTPDYQVRSDAALGAVIVTFSLPTGTDIAAARDSGEGALDLRSANSKPQIPPRATELPKYEAEAERRTQPSGERRELEAFETLDELAALQNQGSEQKAPEKTDSFVERGNEGLGRRDYGSGAEDENSFGAGTTSSEASSNRQAQQPSATGDATVKGIFYQTTKNSLVSSIMVDVENLNSYSLTQRGPGTYELLLRNARLAGEHLALPQFPPDTFKGFEVIVASQAGDNVVVKIYVDSEIKLSPFIAQGRLWLRASE